MPKRYIGLDIGRSHVYAAQVVRTAQGAQVEKAFALQTRRSADSLPAILHALRTRHGFDRRADVAVALPLQAFFFADIERDAAELGQIRAGDTSGLRDCFPIPADEAVAQVCSALPMEGGKYSVLVAASSRQQLDAGVQSLREGKIKPAHLDTPITAVQTTVLTNHPEAATGLAVIVYVDASTLSLALTHQGRMLLVRNIPLCLPAECDNETFAGQAAQIITQEIEITWNHLFGSDLGPGLRLFVVAPRPVRASLASSLQDRIGGQVIPVEPYARVARSKEVDADLPLCVALGLALGGLELQGTAGIDFLAACRARTQPKVRLKKELTVCGALAAAAAVVWLAGLFLQLSSLESDYQGLKRQTEEVFRRTLPEEQTIVDPVAQLQQRLDAFQKEREFLAGVNPGRPAPLEVLYVLSRNAPDTGDLKLNDVLITADSVRITGTCNSFATLSQWQRLLETIPGWRVVDVPRPTKDAPSGQVRFTISLSTEEGQA
jgi:Tfp pilus assembly protein PilN